MTLVKPRPISVALLLRTSPIWWQRVSAEFLVSPVCSQHQPLYLPANTIKVWSMRALLHIKQALQR